MRPPERLLEVREHVVGVLDADGDPHHVGRDAGLALFGWSIGRRTEAINEIVR